MSNNKKSGAFLFCDKEGFTGVQIDGKWFTITMYADGFTATNGFDPEGGFYYISQGTLYL